MSKKEQVTYTMYLNAVAELKKQGQAISVRALQKIIGGSHSTLLEYQRRLQTDTEFASKVEDSISETLKQALLAEFGRMVQSTRDRLEASLAHEKQQLKEANELLADAENLTADLETQYRLAEEQANEKILNLEKQLAATQERVTEHQHQIDKLEQQLKESITAQEFSRMEAAKFKLQLERADKDTEKAEKQNEEMKTKIAKLQEHAHQIEIKAAVSEARISELQKQIGKGK